MFRDAHAYIAQCVICQGRGKFRNRHEMELNFILEVDITKITLKSDLLSQIRGRVVTLRDQIHRELRQTLDLNSYIIKLD